ncbi:alpha/beta hydrolase-fold protein [Spiroplasma sp. AdecLV25b]|uniref:alpha/beta hydrolase-fold protein n=1 Tax=Spiroplasma sp. AdecLV25b TaxID=3027162 RepID=UPI0027E2022C|nr:alpha/beta hydrolase-fold protein [Spiroplasma sp. AdecLV25b]
MNNYQLQVISYASKTLTMNKDIIIALPPNFEETKSYVTYLVFDGKDLLLNNHNILTNNNSNCVYIGISSTNNMTRFNDLAMYTNSEVKTLMTKYFPILTSSNINSLGGNGENYLAFIENEVLPFVTNKFKLKIISLNALGCSMGAYFCLQMLYCSSLTFNTMILLSPAIWFNEQIFNDLAIKALNKNQPLTIKLWVGKKEPKFFEGKISTNYESNTICLEQLLISHKIITTIMIDNNGSHGFKWWINYLNNNPLIFV